MEDYYKTTDLALATTLQLLYEPIWKIERNGEKAEFMFRKTDKLMEMIDQYWRGELKIEPIGYFNELKNIKSRLYDSNKY